MKQHAKYSVIYACVHLCVWVHLPFEGSHSGLVTMSVITIMHRHYMSAVVNVLLYKDYDSLHSQVLRFLQIPYGITLPVWKFSQVVC